MMMNFKKFNESFKNTYIQKDIGTVKHIPICDEEFRPGKAILCDVAKASVNKLDPPVKGPKYAEVQTYTFKMDADLILTDVAPERSKYFKKFGFEHIGSIPVKVTSVTLTLIKHGGAYFSPRKLTPDNFEHILGNLMMTIPLPSEGHTEARIDERDIKYQGLQRIADLPFNFYIYSITFDFLDRDIATKLNKEASVGTDIEEAYEDDFVESCGAMSDYLKESLEREKNNVSE